MKNKRLAYAYVIIGAACWGFIGVFNRMLGAQGVGVWNRVTIRNFLALAVLTVVFACCKRSVFAVKLRQHVGIRQGDGGKFFQRLLLRLRQMRTKAQKLWLRAVLRQLPQARRTRAETLPGLRQAQKIRFRQLFFFLRALRRARTQQTHGVNFPVQTVSVYAPRPQGGRESKKTATR